MAKLDSLTTTLFFLFISFRLTAQSWTPVADYGGGPYSFTTAAVANGRAYVPRDNQWWEYDPQADSWTQKSNFPGVARIAPVSFSIENIIYMGTGDVLFGSLLNDWWKYDPTTDSWQQLNDFPGTERYAAVGFAVGSHGYVATGFATGGIYKADLWEYDPGTDTWIQKAAIPDAGKYLAAGFAVSGKGYVLTGYESIAGDVKDVWEFSPASNSWVAKGNFPGLARRQAAGFASSSKGYIITGGNDLSSFSDAWEYTPVSDSWMSLASLPPGEARLAAAGFALNEEPYVGIGFVPSSVTFDDFWKLPSTQLPLQLVSFSATSQAGGNLLKWTTASETNNDYFTIERAADGINFSAVANIDGKGTCTTISDYSFFDNKCNTGLNYYRLRQTDFDGTCTWSKVVTVEQENLLSSCNILYLPDEHAVLIQLHAANSTLCTLSFIDIAGAVVQREGAAISKGFNQLQTTLPPQLKGICFLEVKVGEEKYIEKLEAR